MGGRGCQTVQIYVYIMNEYWKYRVSNSGSQQSVPIRIAVLPYNLQPWWRSTLAFQYLAFERGVRNMFKIRVYDRGLSPDPQCSFGDFKNTLRPPLLPSIRARHAALEFSKSPPDFRDLGNTLSKTFSMEIWPVTTKPQTGKIWKSKAHKVLIRN